MKTFIFSNSLSLSSYYITEFLLGLTPHSAHQLFDEIYLGNAICLIMLNICLRRNEDIRSVVIRNM